MPGGGTFEVFRTGAHVDTSGRRLAFSEADVAAIAASYDPALHEAPIVVGHPRDDAPAYGWVGALAADGGTLRAEARQVEPVFAELVNAGRFKKVSVALYAPDAPANPKPGGWYLRHVGFLGAQPPAVKGLKPVAFAGSDEGVVEFAETWTLGLVARLFRSLREMLIGQFGQEAADRALPADAIDTVAEAGPLVPPAAPAPLYAEPQQKEPPVADTTRDAQLAERERRIAAEEARLAAERGAFAETLSRTRAAEDAAFLDRLVAEARLPAEARPLAAALLGRADAVEIVAFAEAGEVTEHAALRALLARIGVVLRADPADAARAAAVQIRWRRALAGDPWQQGAQQPARGELLLFTDALTEGDTYEVAARAVSAAGVAGIWTAPVAHVVLGKTAPPSDVAEFRISGRRLDWSQVADPDLAGYRIRWSRGTGVDWGTMLPAHGGLLTASPFVLDDLPCGPVSIAIKAVDDGGRESGAAAAIFTDLGDLPLRLGVAGQDMRAAGFLGSRFGAELDGGDLVAPADATLPMWAASAAAMWTAAAGAMWAATLWPALAYEEDLAFVAPPGSGRVLVDLRAAGAASRVLWRPILAMWSADGALLWTADAALMWSAAAPSDWADLVAPIPASLLPARLRVEVAGGEMRPRITALTAHLDAAPVTEVLADVPLGAGGARLPITRSYAAISAVVATLQAGTGARTLKVLDKDAALGPLLQAYDAAGAGIAASVDATIHGY